MRSAELRSRRPSASAPVVAHPPETTPDPPDKNAFATLFFVNANAFSIMFLYSLAVPTAAQYVYYFISDYRLSGLLIATFEFAAAITQLINYLMLRTLPFRYVILLLVFLQIVGNLLYALALPAETLAMIFVGRALCGLSSGTQVTMVGISTATSDKDLAFKASTVNAFMYQFAGFLAYFVAGFVLLVADDFVTAPNAKTNAATIPAYIATALSVSIFVLALAFLPRRPVKRFRVLPDEYTAQTYRPIVGIYVIFIGTLIEGIRQVNLFELYGRRWRVQTDPPWSFSTASFFSSLIFLVGGVLTFPLDKYFKETRCAIMVATLSVTCSILLLAPWDCSATASILLQAFGGILWIAPGRLYTAFAFQLLLSHGKRSRHLRLWYLVAAVAQNLGIGIGATLGSLFDLSVVPMLIFFGLFVVGSILIPLTWIGLPRGQTSA